MNFPVFPMRKTILRLLAWPFRLLWRLTAQTSWPAGAPFNLRKPLVIDGDTLFHDGRKIRIWGIDAPEIGTAHGPAAKAHLDHLVKMRNIHVVPRDIDAYGRIVAQLFCGRGDIGRSMVEDGYAISRTRDYAGDERKARRKKLGLWARGGISDPAEDRRRARLAA